MLKKIFKFFDKTEDKTRSRLSKHPLLYATIGAVGLVLLWRGVWMVADSLALILREGGGSLDKVALIDGMISVGLSVAVLLGSGLFVSFFIGDRIILSGLKKEKKLEEKTKEEVERELSIDNEIKNKVDKIEHDIEEIKEALTGARGNDDHPLP